LAWLVAFNDGHFESLDVDDITPLLEAFEEKARHTSLSLDDSREEWSTAVVDWLASIQGSTS
jgi:F-type H+-transporting ATPase subunit alpha